MSDGKRLRPTPPPQDAHMAPLGRLWLQLARATLAANAGGVLARTRGLPRTPALRQAMPWRSDSLLLLAVLLGPGIVCKGLRGFSVWSGFCVPITMLFALQFVRHKAQNCLIGINWKLLSFDGSFLSECNCLFL